MGSRPERGAYGNARGKRPKPARRAARLSDSRVATALEEARSHQTMIDAAVAAGSIGTGRPQLVFSKDFTDEQTEQLKEKIKSQPAGMVIPMHSSVEITLKVDWCIKDVYLMLHQGYRVAHIAKRTGYDLEIVVDLWNDLYNEEEEEPVIMV